MPTMSVLCHATWSVKICHMPFYAILTLVGKSWVWGWYVYTILKLSCLKSLVLCFHLSKKIENGALALIYVSSVTIGILYKIVFKKPSLSLKSYIYM
jgi:hypothetical protein